MNTANKIEDRSMADVVDMADKLQAIIDSRDEEKIDEVSKVIGEDWLVAQGFHFMAMGGLPTGKRYMATAYTTITAVRNLTRRSGASDKRDVNWQCWKVPGTRRDNIHYPIMDGGVNIDGAVMVSAQHGDVAITFGDS